MHPDLIQKTPRKRVFIVVSTLVLAGLLTLKIMEANPSSKPEVKAEVAMPVVEMLAQASQPVQTPAPVPPSPPAPSVPAPSPKVEKVAKPEKTEQIEKKKTEPVPAKTKKPTKPIETKVAAVKLPATPAVKPDKNKLSEPKESPAAHSKGPTVTEEKVNDSKEMLPNPKAAIDPNEQADRDRLKNLIRNPSRTAPSGQVSLGNQYKEAFEKGVSSRLHGRLGNVRTRLVVTAQFDDSGQATRVDVEEPNKANSPIAKAAAGYLRHLTIPKDSSNPVPSNMHMELIVEGRE